MTNLDLKLLSNKTFIISFIVFSFIVFKPNTALAATVFLSPEFNSVAVGDIVIVDVKINTENKLLNTVEGIIAIDGYTDNIEFSRQSTANSVLKYWPQSPSVYNDSLISFVGGVPGGVNQESGLLFKIIFLAKKEGAVVFQPKNIKAYENDGQGTLVECLGESFAFNINPKTEEKSKNDWMKIISTDKTTPQNLNATFGQDPSIFEGKKIITISADDTESGIDYFEVKEGDRPSVRTGDIYVLLDQDESSSITITAYDKSGNRSQIILNPIRARVNFWVKIIGSIISVLVFSGLATMVIRQVKKNKK